MSAFVFVAAVLAAVAVGAPLLRRQIARTPGATGSVYVTVEAVMQPWRDALARAIENYGQFQILTNPALDLELREYRAPKQTYKPRHAAPIKRG